jgi:hypothetical protein
MPEIYLLRALLGYYKSQIDPAARETSRTQASADLELALRLEPTNLTLRRTAKRIRNVLRGPLWAGDRTWEVRSKNYVSRTDTSEEKAKWMVDHLEAVRPLYAKVLRCEGEQQFPAEVFLFSTAEQYHNYGAFTTEDPGAGTAGYFHPEYRQFLFYQMENEEGTLHVLIHEGFHHYARMVIPHLPSWLNEACAEYVGGCTIKNGKVEQEGVVNPFLKERIQGMVMWQKEGWEPASFEEMMKSVGWRMDSYYQGWAMVYWFLRAEDGKYAHFLHTYIDVLRNEQMSGEEAFHRAFPNREDRELDSIFRKYLKETLFPMAKPQESPPE